MAHAPEPLDTGLACLVTLARYQGVPAEPAELAHRFGRPGQRFDATGLVRAARHLGLRARAIESRWARLGSLALPALAAQRDGRWVLLARADRDRALVQDPAAPAPVVVPRERFEATWSGTLVLCVRRAGAPSPAGRFGFAWFIPAILRYRTHLGEVLLASFVLQLLGLASPLATQVVIDKVLVHGGLSTLDVLAAGMLGLIVFESVLGGLRAYLFAHTSSRIDAELGARLFRHVLGLPLAYFEVRRVGDTVARVRELESLRQFLTGSPLTALLDVVFAGVFLGVMWLYSPSLTALVAASLPGYAVLSFVLTPVLRGRLAEKFTRGAESHCLLVETVRGIETVKALAVEPGTERRWEEQLAGYVRAAFRATQAAQLGGQLASALSKATAVGILWVGARLVMAGELSVGELVAFTMLAGRVSGPLLRLVQLWHEFQQASVSVERLGDLLDAPREAPRRPAVSSPPAVAGRVVFEEVHFRYRADGPDILRGVSFSAAPGEVVAIVGPSGGGKSTIAKLIPRLYVPDRGRVLLDGLDLREVDTAWLRRRVSLVPQETVLFTGTVRENIALADPGLPMTQVVAAARLAGAHEVILDLPGGYDAPVGEHGCALSGGQRQRIAIARALLTTPAVLILDESTSALDGASERLFRQGLAAMAAGRTVFIIAHRLSTVRGASRVLVIDRGRVVEQGRPAALLGTGGYYARLHRDQEGAEGPGAPGRAGPGVSV